MHAPEAPNSSLHMLLSRDAHVRKTPVPHQASASALSPAPTSHTPHPVPRSPLRHIMQLSTSDALGTRQLSVHCTHTRSGKSRTGTQQVVRVMFTTPVSPPLGAGPPPPGRDLGGLGGEVAFEVGEVELEGEVGLPLEVGGAAVSVRGGLEAGTPKGGGGAGW